MRSKTKKLSGPRGGEALLQSALFQTLPKNRRQALRVPRACALHSPGRAQLSRQFLRRAARAAGAGRRCRNFPRRPGTTWPARPTAGRHLYGARREHQGSTRRAERTEPGQRPRQAPACGWSPRPWPAFREPRGSPGRRADAGPRM